MSDGDIVLQFGLEEGRNADAVIAAEALIAWVDTVRDAARAIDPDADVRVELLGREKGSLRQLLRLVDDHAKVISEGADEYPYLKKAALGLALAVATSTISVVVQATLHSGTEVVELSPEDRELLKGMTDQIHNDHATGKSAERFFQLIERDPAITDVKIADGFDRPPIVTIPRKDFAFRGGMWTADAGPPPEEIRRARWTVVLLQAPFYNSPRHWQFDRDGLKFSAQMLDLAFLQAITDRRLPISLQEGVTMDVEVEYRERLNGQVWEYVPDTRKIVRVLSPRPLPSSHSGPPEK